MNRNNRSYFPRILLFGVLISALPVIIIGIFSYYKASEEVQRGAYASKGRQLTQIQSNVENSLKTADRTLTYFVNTSLLKSTLSEPIVPRQFQLYNQIRQELTHLQTFDTGISDIRLISTEMGWVINNNGLYRSHQVADIDLDLQLMDRPFDSFWTIEDNEERPLTVNSCRTNLQLVKKLPLNTSNKRGLVISEIPICQLSSMFSFDKQNESVMIADRDNRIFLHANPSLPGLSDVKDGVFQKISAEMQTTNHTSGQFPLGDLEPSFMVTYQKSDYNGWTYISFVNIRELTKESRAIGWFTLYVCLALVIGALIVAWIFSLRVNNPIRRLFLTNAQLENKVQDQNKQLNVLFMLRLLYGDMTAKDIEHRKQTLGLVHRWNCLALVTVQVDSIDDTRYQDNDRDLLLFAVNNIMEELIDPDMRLTPLVVDQTQATVVMINNESPKEVQEELYQLALNIQQTIHQYLRITVSVGVSLPYQDLSKTQQAYAESLEALKNRVRLGDQTIIFYHDLPQGALPIHSFFPNRVLGELSDAVKLADHDKSRQLLTEFFRELSDKQLGPNQYEIWTARLLIDFVHLAHTTGIPYLPFTDNQSIFEQLFKWRSPREIQEWLWTTVVEPILVAVEERTNNQYKKISEQMIVLIQEKFDQDISLESIAELLHYNANYISSVFRKETGVSFSEYLASYRHNIALQYLLDTDLSIKEISLKLRYNNAQNFIRSFRKTEGVTPGQYREKKVAK